MSQRATSTSTQPSAPSLVEPSLVEPARAETTASATASATTDGDDRPSERLTVSADAIRFTAKLRGEILDRVDAESATLDRLFDAATEERSR